MIDKIQSHESIDIQYEACLSELNKNFDQKYIIISPPRCASTAVARTFWEFPTVSYYCHEPYESYYYNSSPLSCVFSKLLSPIKIPENQSKNKSSLVIKEMSFQVGNHFEHLAKYTSHPLLFLIRDPRLSIESRIKKKIEGGLSTNFPSRETGWEDIYNQVQDAEQKNISYHILDTTDFRLNPYLFTQKLCELYEAPFNSSMLSWNTRNDLSLDNLGGKHEYLYTRVLASNGIQPPLESIPNITDFSETNGLRDHVVEAVTIYEELLTNKNRII